MELVHDKIVPLISLHFLESPENVVIEEGTEKIEIHLPISSFDGLYTVIKDGVEKNKFPKLTIDKKQGWSFATFDLRP